MTKTKYNNAFNSCGKETSFKLNNILNNIDVIDNTQITRSATIVIAASDSSARSKAQADYVCDGTADNVEIQAALDALPTTGGEIKLLEGIFQLAATPARAIPNVMISGMGYSTYIKYNATNFVFSIGTQANWRFDNLRVDYGGIERANGVKWGLSNVWRDNSSSTIPPILIDCWSYDHLAPRSCGNFMAETQNHPAITVLDDFESDHWTSANSTVTYDTDIKFIGTRSLKIVTQSGVSANVEYSTAYPDLTNCSYGMWIYTPDYTKIDRITLNVVTTNTTWSIYAYANFATQYTINDHWHFIAFPDLNQIFGAVNFTNAIRMRIVIVPAAGQVATVYIDKFVYWKQRLISPKGCVSFTFDDGLASVYTLAKPVMDKYNYTGVASISPSKLDSTAIINENWLQNIGWDICSHTFDHRSNTVSTTDPEFQYIYTQKWLSDNGFERGSRFALLHGGAHNAKTIKLLENNLAFARSSVVGYNSLPGIGTTVYVQVPKMNVPVATVKTWIDTAVSKGLWLILMFHEIIDTPVAEYDYSTSNFTEIVEYCHSTGIEVKTFSQIVDRIKSTAQHMNVSGTGTITSGTTSVNIRHGFSKAPSSIKITQTSSLGSASSMWVSSTDTGTGNLFTVSVNVDPGADVTFMWEAVL